jgi:hypothetical protein
MTLFSDTQTTTYKTRYQAQRLSVHFTGVVVVFSYLKLV